MATILIVDDCATSREFLVVLLGYPNHQLLEAVEGEEALEIAQKKHPDLIIIDIFMSTLNGSEWMQRLRANPELADIPVIFYTAAHRIEQAQLLGDAYGVKFLLSKPSDPKTIFDTVNQALGINLEQSSRVSSQLFALIKLNMDLTIERDPRKLLQLFCDGARRMMNANYCVSGILNSRGDKLEYFFSSGLGAVARTSIGVPGIEQNLIAHLLKQRDVLKINNFLQHSEIQLPEHHPAIRCLLGSSIKTATHLYGFFYLADKLDETEFNEDDVRIVATLASEIGILYENIKFYEVIQRHAASLQLEITERKKLQEALSKSEVLFRQFAENIQEVFFRITPELDKVIYISPAFEKVWGYSTQSLYQNPRLWFDSILSEDQPNVHGLLFQEILKKGATYAAIEYRICRSDGTIRNIYVRAFPMRDSTGEVINILGIATDITEFQQARQRATAQQEVVKILENCKSINEAAPQLLKIICNTLNWDLGEIWIVDKTKNILRCIDTWHNKEADVALFIKATLEMVINPGIGLPGRVWQVKEPLWILDVTKDPEFSRAIYAEKAGLHTSYVLPILHQDKVEGVMEFFSCQIRPLNNDLLKLIGAIGTQIGTFIQQKHSEDQLTHIAHHDILTGLLNRSTLEENLNQMIQKTSPSIVATIVFDIDRFSLINDAVGHDAGDFLLQLIAERLRKFFFQKEVLAARLGGDKFLLAFVRIQNIEEVAAYASQILALFESSFFIKGQEIFITASMGISLYPQDGQDSRSLLQAADSALMRAKEDGGNNFQFCMLEFSSFISEKLALENALRQALAKNQLQVYYQPKIDLKTGVICGVEALLRWQHPEKGLLRPDAFLSIAEETGLIVPIGEWVLREACLQITQDWLKVPIAVNLSIEQFKKQHHLTAYIEKLIKELQVPPDHLELEITESLLMSEGVTQNLETLSALKKMGMKLSLDDFGTGYSSLNYLTCFPVSKIKIDKSFIDRLPGDARNATIVKAIITLAHSLGLRVIAEGVKTDEQLKFLMMENCDEMQGYYFSRPLPVNELKVLIEANQKLKIS